MSHHSKEHQAKAPQEKNTLFLIIIAASSCFLSSCTSYEESFSTEPGTGSGWKSMSDTYVLGHAADKEKEATEQNLKQGVEQLDPLYTRDTDAAQKDALYCSGKSESIERMPEEYLRVWMAPYQDRQGNMVEGYYVISLMKQGQWVVTSATDGCGESS